MWIRLIVAGLSIIGIVGCNNNADGELETRGGACKIASKNWKTGYVEPPSLVRVWNIGLLPNSVVVNRSRMADDDALQLVEGTKNFDPGAYVLLNQGSADCDRVEAIALQIDDRFDCEMNYCYFVSEDKTSGLR